MELSELLEKHSIKSISKKTRISGDDLNALIESNFSNLKKIKSLGFISILEREYNIDLKLLRKSVHDHYGSNFTEDNLSLDIPIQNNQGHSKLFLFIILSLFAYATWFFVGKFDQSKLENLITFTEKLKVEDLKSNDIQKIISKKTEEILDIETALKFTNTEIQEDQSKVKKEVANSEFEKNIEVEIENNDSSDIIASDDENKTEKIALDTKEAELNDTSISIVIEENLPKAIDKVLLIPERKLWFGIIDKTTMKKSNSSISKQFDIDVKEKEWLVATSPAAFSLIFRDKIKEYNDGKRHYFKLTKEGVLHLNKEEYLAEGGYAKW